MERTNNARRDRKHTNRIRRIMPAAIATISAAIGTANAGAASGTWTFNPAVTWNASWSTPTMPVASRACPMSKPRSTNIGR